MITATYKGKYHDVEYSIVNVSELEGELRIDAEYYDPFWIKIERKIKRLNSDILSNVATNAYTTFNNKNCDKFYYIEIANIDLLSGDYQIKEIPCQFAPSRAKKVVEKNDILISTVRPNRNAVAFIFEVNKNPLVASTGFCKLKVISNKVKPHYLFVLFKTVYYKDLLTRKTTATMYPAVSEEDIMNLKIPIPSSTFQKFIERLVLETYEERKKAEQFYKQAEEILLEELGLKNWKPKTKKIKIGGQEFEEEENISIRMLSEVVKVDRIDAEYWEPRYDEFLTNLAGRVSLESLKNFLCSKPLKGVEVGSRNYQEKGIPFIRVSNISKFGIVEKDQKYISEELYLELKDKFEPQKGEILLTKDATPGIAYVLKEDIKGIIASGIVRLQVKNIKKEYLALLINSIVGQMQILREGGGAIISHWKPSQIENLIIPLLNFQIQQKISQLVQQSFEAKEKSKKLLEIAKRAVEIYIEENESKGIEYANGELKKLNININDTNDETLT